jgi:hypothetical protein
MKTNPFLKRASASMCAQSNDARNEELANLVLEMLAEQYVHVRGRENL